MGYVNIKHINFISGSTFLTGSDGKVKPNIISGKWEIDPDDGQSLQFRVPSQSFAGNHDRIGFYVSASGRIGIGTKDPETAFDVRDVGEDVDPNRRDLKTKIFRINKKAQTFDTPVTASIMSASKIISTTITTTGNISSSGEFHGSNIGPIYEDYIYLTPTDFDHQTDKVAVTVSGEIENNGGYIADNNARANYHAQKIIPKGYKATHVKLVGSSASDEFVVYSSSFDVNTAAQCGTAGNPNTEKSITSIIGGNGTYCSILWASRGNTDIYGGYIKLVLS